jgi:photosystem II stability/assembly factor-like uncharacterized protein
MLHTTRKTIAARAGGRPQHRLMRVAGGLLLSVLALVSLSATSTSPADPLQLPAQTSRLAASSPLFAITRAGSRLVAVGQRGHILLSDDRGASWQQAAVPVSVDLTAVHFASPQRGWAVGHDGVILHTSDGGVHWALQLDGRQAAQRIVDAYTPRERSGNAELDAVLTEAKRMLAQGPDLPWLDVWFDDDNNGYAVGAFNLVFSTRDGGTTWLAASDRVDNPRGYHLYALRGDSGGELYAAGELGLLLRLDRTSQRFVAVPTPYKGTFFGVLARPDLLLAYGLRGNAWRSPDGGRTWQKAETGVDTGLTGGTLLDDGGILLVSQGGQLLLSRDNAGHFTAVPGLKASPAFGVVPAAGSSVALVGARGVRLENIR